MDGVMLASMTLLPMAEVIEHDLRPPRTALAVRLPQQADDDAQLVRLWLHGRSAATTTAYRAGIAAFLRFVGHKPLHKVRLADLHDFQDSLAHLRPASVACKLAAIKSLFSFAHDLGYLPINTARVVKLPPVRDCRAERILSETAVHRMLALETCPRNVALLTLVYASGLRISEVTGLRQRDLQERGDSGQVTAFGKGGKTRAVLLPASVWALLALLRVGCAPDDALFRSKQGGGPLNRLSVHRVVKLAARRAGLGDAVSAHWLRHAHASHSLDRGAPISLVTATLGHASAATTSRYLHARPGDSSALHLGL